MILLYRLKLRGVARFDVELLFTLNLTTTFVQLAARSGSPSFNGPTLLFTKNRMANYQYFR